MSCINRNVLTICSFHWLSLHHSQSNMHWICIGSFVLQLVLTIYLTYLLHLFIHNYNHKHEHITHLQPHHWCSCIWSDGSHPLHDTCRFSACAHSPRSSVTCWKGPHHACETLQAHESWILWISTESSLLHLPMLEQTQPWAGFCSAPQVRLLQWTWTECHDHHHHVHLILTLQFKDGFAPLWSFRL